MSSVAICVDLEAHSGPLALKLEPFDGAWRITITDTARSTVLHRARAATLEDAKRCAQDLALVYRAGVDGSASEDDLVWTAAVA
jgi:hypothetical protein